MLLRKHRDSAHMQDSLYKHLCSPSATLEKLIAFYVFKHEHAIIVITQQLLELLLYAMYPARHWQDKGE